MLPSKWENVNCCSAELIYMFLQKTRPTTCIGLQAEQIFSGNT